LKKTFIFKLYDRYKNHHIHEQINIACDIYNYCIAFQRAYYKLYKKYCPKYTLQKHITKVKNKHSDWDKLNSQAIQNITDRIHLSYKAFFKDSHTHGLPHFKRKCNYKSFTLKQCGFKFNPDNTITIGKVDYKYYINRPIEGKVKTVTIKRNKLGDIYIYAICEVVKNKVYKRTGKAVGLDFGLKTYLTTSDGNKIESPLFYKQHQQKLKRLHRQLSRKVEGSNDYKKAKLALEREYKKLTNQRYDNQFKLALNLISNYAVICIEDLNIAAMKKLWGKKISDLSFSQFVKILQYECDNCGSELVKIDKYYPSSQTCNKCGYINKATKNLKIREWDCPNCHAHHDRDVNAAVNICNEGLRMLGL
jgi:putative transposase